MDSTGAEDAIGIRSPGGHVPGPAIGVGIVIEWWFIDRP